MNDREETTLKVTRLGKIGGYGEQTMSVFVKIVLRKGKKGDEISFSGVEGPKANGDAYGSCGQIDMHADTWEFAEYAPGWDAAKVKRLLELWRQWHLNGMHAGCVHQRKLDVTRKVEVVQYKLTTEAYYARQRVREAAANHALEGKEFPKQEPMIEALGRLDDWFKPRFTPPNADDPLSGCYEVEKREMKAIGWVSPNEHPDGILGKACEECGYKYGSAWLHEPLPQEVIDEVKAMPDADVKPAWV